MDREGDDETAPGWDALDAVFEKAFVGQTPEHWRANQLRLPAQDGPWGISGYKIPDGWFYVTYGLSDLFDAFKKPDLPADVVWSGFGLELTMRVRSDDASAPIWPVDLLDKLGQYVYTSRSGFEDGHRLDPRGPITGGHPPTRLTALAFATDPVFDAIDTPLGRVEFITAVGITADELARMKASGTSDVLAELRHQFPTLMTDVDRQETPRGWRYGQLA